MFPDWKKMSRRSKKLLLMLGVFFVLINSPLTAHAMHIMEGFLPLKWCVIWGVLAIPFVIVGFRSISKTVEKNPDVKMLLGVVAAFVFVLSALKIPSVTGSCSHPTGVGLGAILFGPTAMSVIGCIVLIFQALLLAHGGFSTLGANTFSMAIIGPFVAYFVYKLCQKLKAPTWLGVFLAAALGNLLTYVTTSFQLALAFPAEVGGFAASLTKFMGIFAVTQIPLAVAEGLLTVVLFNLLTVHNKRELEELAVISTPAKAAKGV